MTLARPSICANCRHPAREGQFGGTPSATQPIDERPVGRQDVPRAGSSSGATHARSATSTARGSPVDDPARVDEHHEVERRIGVEQHVPDPADLDASTPISSRSSRTSAATGASPGSTLPPGKLPLQRQRLIGAALRDQDAAVVADDQPGDHELARARLGHAAAPCDRRTASRTADRRRGGTRRTRPRSIATIVDDCACRTLAVDARRGQLARELAAAGATADVAIARACDRRARVASARRERRPRARSRERCSIAVAQPLAAREARRAEPVVAQHVDAARRARSISRVAVSRRAYAIDTRVARRPTRGSCSRTRVGSSAATYASGSSARRELAHREPARAQPAAAAARARAGS